jgi:hypothetical protein
LTNETNHIPFALKISTHIKNRMNTYLGKHQEIFTLYVIPGACSPYVSLKKVLKCVEEARTANVLLTKPLPAPTVEP